MVNGAVRARGPETTETTNRLGDITRKHRSFITGSQAGVLASCGETNNGTRSPAMAKYRNHLPQLDGQVFLTDGGIETTLIFHEKIDLPCFAAFDLLKDQRGTDVLRRYYARYTMIARESGTGFILDSATWRANPDWAEKIGYPPRELDVANARAINMLFDLRAAHETESSPMVISGC